MCNANKDAIYSAMRGVRAESLELRPVGLFMVMSVDQYVLFVVRSLERLNPYSSFLMCGYTFRNCMSRSYIKVIGSRSPQQKAKNAAYAGDATLVVSFACVHVLRSRYC